MRDEDTFQFESGQRGGSQFPAVLLAVVAIAAILIVNSTALVSDASASATPRAPDASSFKLMPALLQDATHQSEGAVVPACASTRAMAADTLRTM
jgi:hypothetical protein